MSALPTVESVARAHRDAITAYNVGDFTAAARLAGDVLRAAPDTLGALVVLGAAQRRLGHFEAARATLERATRLRPDSVEAWHQLATCHWQEGQTDAALGALDRAATLAPTDARFGPIRAEILLTAGRTDEADAILRQQLAAPSPDPGSVLAFARLAHRQQRTGEAIDRLSAMLDAPGLDESARVAGLFRLTELLDAAGEHDRAFAAASEANTREATLLGMPPFDAGAWRSRIDALIRAWSPDAVRRVPRARGVSELPVFIVGMPRSGTSLIEQILDAHPLVIGAGERIAVPELVSLLQGDFATDRSLLLNPERLEQSVVDRAAGAFVTELGKLAPSRRAAGGAPARKVTRITDKLPTNFLHLGAIRSVLPGARVLHCLRDAQDTCLSVFFQHFSQPLPFKHDLRAIGAFYVEYQRLMAHWSSVLDLRTLDVVYEELVAETASGARRVIDFLGLAWDDACLRFHESRRITVTASMDQVRRPVYRTSVRRHERYARHLAPLREALGLR